VCGIAGRVNFASGAPVLEETVRRMCALIEHRGPDGEGVFVDGPVGLGHRRLAIIDLSPGGHQPKSAAGGQVWITFNGEIYNFQELRTTLEARGHRFHTESDTEVLLAAYLEYDVGCLDHLRGMFAFAVWDGRTRTLFIARDRLGKKPLHYRIDSDGIAFASEPKAFLAEDSFVPEANAEAISHYLTYQYVPSPYSAFKGVRKLPPAHYLLIRDGRVRVERYWKLRYGPKQRISEREASEEIVRRLTESVRLRLISDVPLGAFLSGGVDSSVVVALMAQLSRGPVKTFSIGFEEKEYDELKYASAVARRFETDHHEFVVRPDASEIFDRLVWHYNEPYADESAIPTYYLSRLTRQYVTVALNGDAGDENFAGYQRYSPENMLELYGRLPAALRRFATSTARNLRQLGGPSGLIAKVQRWLDRGGDSPAGRYARRLMYFDPAVKASICTPEFMRAIDSDGSQRLLLDVLNQADNGSFLDAMMQADVELYLPDCLLVKVDIASMAHGLEARSPLLDHTFMEFVSTLPVDFKLMNGAKKYIFKKAAAHLVPAEILSRPKMGFGVPLEYWFRGALRELTREVLLSSSAARGYFRRGVIERWIDEHERGIRNWHDQLWTMLMLELWHRAYIDQSPLASMRASGEAFPTAVHRSGPRTTSLMTDSRPAEGF
jgi:asparagine synthase (glutamine-hydrolysing)